MSPTEEAPADASLATPASQVEERSRRFDRDERAADGDGDDGAPAPPAPASADGPETSSPYPYVTGIPTLRSSAHRVRWSAKKNRHRRKDRPRGVSGDTTVADGEGGGISSRLPPSLRAERVIAYDPKEYNLHDAVVDILGRSEAALLGGWPDDDDVAGGGDDNPRGGCEEASAAVRRRAKGRPGRRTLDAFRVPPRSLSRRDFGGQCEDSQRYLSDCVANDGAFLEAFDRLVTEVAIPDLKSRLVGCGLVAEGGGTPVSFYYQRPPTLRLQPGPSKSTVKAHRDSEYGHQDGELNFWIPLVDCSKSGCYLWTESEPDKGDYRPLFVKYGEIGAFHGSYCRHYVPANDTVHTRASLDFRVGIGGLFDPEWMMIGTKDDHSRREVEL